MLAVHEGCYELSDFLDRTLSLGLDETVSCNGTQVAVFTVEEEQFHMLVYALTLFGVSPR